MRVAIADDHEIVREGLRWMLDAVDGVEIVSDLDNGADLIETLGRDGDNIDVVLLDLRMPNMTGFDVLKALPEVAPNVKVLVLSMHDEPAFIRRAFELGASGYVRKSADQKELTAALQRVHMGLHYIDADAAEALAAGLPGAIGSLTPRQLEVVRLVAEGLENKQIARHLDLSEATIKSYLKSAFARLDVSSRAEAVAVALRAGIID